jgi:SAM-dependent methyltransferase
MLTTTDIAGYYDGFVDRLVDDYENGNPRVSVALEFARHALAPCRSILDVGCGVGWTSMDLANTGKTVVGIDISPALIDKAKELFGDLCTFVAGDFVATDTASFDGVLMVDVYEHFPRESWPAVHEQIRSTGASRVVLTMPTPATQQYARDHGIALQPVDEDVTDTDIETLAAEIGGQVTVNRVVDVWRPGDYRHVLIEVTR